MIQGSVLIVCALMPEAAPLIDALGLDPGPKYGSVRIFGANTQTPLAISGIGGHASATAVGLLRAQRCERERPSVLNVGVSGHASRPRGTAWLAHQVVGEQGPSHPLYPGFIRRPHLPTDVLTTRSQVEKHFAAPGGYDMEGFGCLSAALCVASAEQCALLKVVSDGPAAHQGPTPFRLDAKQARALIKDALPAIQEQLRVLLGVSQGMTERNQPPRYTQEILQTGHFSQAQRHRLTSLLTQWNARYPDQSPDVTLFAKGTQDGLDALHAKLSAYEPLHAPPELDEALKPKKTPLS